MAKNGHSKCFLTIFPQMTGINSEWPKMAILNFSQKDWYKFGMAKTSENFQTISFVHICFFQRIFFFDKNVICDNFFQGIFYCFQDCIKVICIDTAYFT